MRKLWNGLWILWALIGIANLLFINVYNVHFALLQSLMQTLVYWGLSLILMVIVGAWWIGLGKSNMHKFPQVLGGIVMAIALLGIAGILVYTFVFNGGATIIAITKSWADLINFITF